jgi:hypothetical protein
MRNFWAGVIILAISLIWFTNTGTVLGTSNRLVTDISWPNCSLSIAKADFGIVGINGGLARRPNPCLAKEAGDYKHLSVYVNTGYSGASNGLKFQSSPRHCSAANNQCLAYNYGFNAGLYDIDYSLKQGVIADRWWLDVEIDNSWSNDYKINRQMLRGMLDAISSFAGKNNLGFYSTGLQWKIITGRWRNGYPVWFATGSTLKADAIATCAAKSFAGGPVLLAQYTPSLDANYICY